MNRLSGPVVLTAIFSLGLAACGETTTPDPMPQPENTRLRVIHLSPDAPAVDVFANGGESAIVSGLAFPEGTDYLTIPAGTYSIDVAPEMAGIGSSVLNVPGLELAENASYTAAAIGNVASIGALALMDDTSTPEMGMIRVRAIHAAPAVGQVDIWNIPEMGSPAPLYENVDFGVAGAYLELPAGAYTLGFDVDNDANPDVIFTTPELAAGTIANVFATNDSQGTVFLAAQLADGTVARIDATPIPQPEPASIRVVHLSPDAPAVDVFANGDGSAAVVSGLAFPEGTDYLQVPAGTYDFDIAPEMAGIGSSVLNISGLELAEGGSYTAAAIGNVASIGALALMDDTTEPAMGMIRIRAIHAAAAVGQVDIWNIPEMGSPAPLYENVDFGVAGAYLELPAGSYTLGFDVDNDANPDVVFTTPALAAGTIANVFATNDASGTVFLAAQLNDGTIARIDRVEEPARIRVLHLSPDAPAVDVFANGGAAVQGLGFGQGTGYLEVPAGTYDFSVSPENAGIGSSVLDILGLELAEGVSYTAVAFDNVANISPLALVDDYESLAAGNIRVRAIHAAPGVGQVDIWNIPAMGAPTPLYENVDFGVAGGYYDLPAGSYTLGFDVNDDGTPDVTFTTPELAAGTKANVFATNDASGTVFLAAQLNDGTVARIDAN